MVGKARAFFGFSVFASLYIDGELLNNRKCEEMIDIGVERFVPQRALHRRLEVIAGKTKQELWKLEAGQSQHVRKTDRREWNHNLLFLVHNHPSQVSSVVSGITSTSHVLRTSYSHGRNSHKLLLYYVCNIGLLVPSNNIL